MIKFEVGKTYTCRSACDHNCTWSYCVVARTACTVTLMNIRECKTVKRRIDKYITEKDGIEAVLPEGNFSMCPILRAA